MKIFAGGVEKKVLNLPTFWKFGTCLNNPSVSFADSSLYTRKPSHQNHFSEHKQNGAAKPLRFVVWLRTK